VQYVFRGHLFARGTTASAIQGVFCAPAVGCELQNAPSGPGGARPAGRPGGPASAAYPGAGLSSVGGRGAAGARLAPGGLQTPLPGAGGAGPPGGGLPPPMGRRESQVGKVVTVLRGPYRNLRGRIVSADTAAYQIYLETRRKEVSVPRAFVDGGGGGAPGAMGVASGYTAGRVAAGFAAARGLGGHTPGTGWGNATPGYGGRTPGYGGMTPGYGGRTPAYGECWGAGVPRGVQGGPGGGGSRGRGVDETDPLAPLLSPQAA